jgi:hypothetical protein
VIGSAKTGEAKPREAANTRLKDRNDRNKRFISQKYYVSDGDIIHKDAPSYGAQEELWTGLKESLATHAKRVREKSNYKG